MKIDANVSSQWMVEFEKQLIRGKQVLLHGNVADQSLLNGNYCSVMKFLDDYLVSLGYGVVSFYDMVDGFRFAREPMRATFDRVIGQRLGASARAAAPSALRATGRGFSPAEPVQSEALTPSDRTASAGRAPAAPDGGPPPRGVPGTAPASVSARPPAESGATSAPAAQPSAGRGASTLRDPQQAFAALRELMRQNDETAAAIVSFSDLLTSAADRQDFNERTLMLQLFKMMQEAPQIPAGALAGRRNVLVLVAAQLATVPDWLYKDNPLLSLVRITRPRRMERMTFVRSFAHYFFGGESLADQELEQVAQDFANLTDGLAAWDLEAIRRTSHAERLSIRRPKSLVDFYNYGLRHDPWESLDRERIASARLTLEQRVIGQPQALRAVEGMLMSARVGVRAAPSSPLGGQPKGVFFFVGPTGVGKTELSKALTELIFSDESAFARFDMSEYAQEHAAERLTGPPPGYVGHDEGGVLTNRVRERPFSLLLFDEIEKANKKIMDKFLQILEDGRMTDGKGQTAYFSQTAIIFTSNIGSKSLHTLRGADGSLPSYPSVVAHYRAAVANHFNHELGRPELLNRFGENILVFDLLRPEYVRGILEKFLRQIAASIKEKTQRDLVFPDASLAEYIAQIMNEADNMQYGGRRIKAILEDRLVGPLNRWLFGQIEIPQRLEVTAAAANGEIYVNGDRVS